ncbi:MAG: hypothetical protein L0Y71_25285 [Gemmataceae bacterium]|nr:hypothetical protein [Gemmataceae bacterium]
MFDAYHKWLGIPKDQRPPSHYQLLGIAAGEADPEVIEEAAVRQTAHVRNYQIGPNAADATRILNEISHAKLTLLNPAKRRAYDEQLARTTAAITTKAPQAVAVGADPAFAFDEPEDRPPPPPARRDVSIARPSRGNTGMIIGLSAVGGAAVLLLVIALVVMLSHRTEAPIVKNDEKKDKPILRIPDDPMADKDRPIVVHKPPVIVPQPVVNPPGNVPAAGVVPPGARSFRIKEKRIDWLSLSPDGTKVALGWGAPHVYDVATGKHLATFPWPGKGGAIITPVAFLPDNQRVLYAYGCDPAAAVGDAATGARLFQLPQEGVQYASCLVVAPDGKRALAGYNHRVVYWDLENQKEIKSWPTNQPTHHEIAFTPDGTKAVIAQRNGTISYWDLELLEEIAERHYGNLAELHSLSMAPDGKSVAIGSRKALAILELPVMRLKMLNFPDDPSNHTAVAFFGKGKYLLTGGKNGLIHMFDLEGLRRVVTWHGHTAEVSRIAVDAKERMAVSGDRSGAAWVWPLPDGPVAAAPAAPAAPAPAPPDAVPGARSFKTKERIDWLALAPDGAKVMVAFIRAHSFDLAAGQHLATFHPTKGGGSIHTPVAFFPDGRRILCAFGSAPAVIIGEAATGLPLFRLEQEGVQYADSVAVAPDGKRGLAGYNYRLVYWDLDTQKEIMRWKVEGIVSSVVFTPDGRRAVTGDHSGNVVLWDLDKQERLRSVNLRKVNKVQGKVSPKVLSLTLSPDGWTACASTDVDATLIDLKTMQTRIVLADGNGAGVAFCAAGKQLLTGGRDGLIRVWDVATLKQVTTWRGHLARVTRLAVDAKERLAVSGDWDSTVWVWPLPDGPIAAAPDAPGQEAGPKGLRRIVTRGAQGVYAAAILPDGKSFVTGGLTVQYWDMDGRLRHIFAKRRSSSERFMLSMSADGKRAAWAESQDPATVVDLDKGIEIGRMVRGSNVSAMALSPDGSRLVTGHFDGSSAVWDVATQQVIQELPKHAPPPLPTLQPFSIGFVPGGKHALFALINGKVQLLDTTTWKPAAEALTAPFPSTPAFTADGQTAAMATRGGVWLFDTRNLRTLGKLPINNAQRLAFCAKGQLLLTMVAAEQSVAVWDVAKREIVTRWHLPEKCHALAVDAQESFALAVCMSNNAYTWPLPATPQELAAAKP